MGGGAEGEAEAARGIGHGSRSAAAVGQQMREAFLARKRQMQAEAAIRPGLNRKSDGPRPAAAAAAAARRGDGRGAAAGGWCRAAHRAAGRRRLARAGADADGFEWQPPKDTTAQREALKKKLGY